MSPAVKICGLRDEPAIQSLIDSGVNYAGFVYYRPSPRHIEIRQAVALKALLPRSIRSVSVLVDPDDQLVADIGQHLRPDCLQLHGKETPERLRQIRRQFPEIKLIKALAIRSGDDVANAASYSDCADMLLFDAKAPQLPGMLPGGNGLSFDWELLKNRQFSLPWFLSGGLNADNISEAVRQSGAQMVDISSGVECAPGVKEPALIKAFMNKVRSL